MSTHDTPLAKRVKLSIPQSLQDIGDDIQKALKCTQDIKKNISIHKSTENLQGILYIFSNEFNLITNIEHKKLVEQIATVAKQALNDCQFIVDYLTQQIVCQVCIVLFVICFLFFVFCFLF